MSNDRYRRIAKRWRDEYGYKGKGGVVVIHQGTANGWVNGLRDPQHWQPGCVAVAEDGTCHQAVGGTAYDGAARWQQVAA